MDHGKSDVQVLGYFVFFLLQQIVRKNANSCGTKITETPCYMGDCGCVCIFFLPNFCRKAVRHVGNLHQKISLPSPLIRWRSRVGPKFTHSQPCWGEQDVPPDWRNKTTVMLRNLPNKWAPEFVGRSRSSCPPLTHRPLRNKDLRRPC